MTNYVDQQWIDDNFKNYTDAEKQEVYAYGEGRFLGKNPPEWPLSNMLLVTAGPPGSGKSKMLRQYVQDYPEFDYIVVDPNDTCIVGLPGYRREIETLGEKPSDADLQALYERWRPAGEYVARYVNTRAIEEHYNLAIAGTSSSKGILKFYQTAIEQHGYRLNVLAVSSPLDIAIERSQPHNRMRDVADGLPFWIPPQHVTEKRADYWGFMKSLIIMSSSFQQYWNPDNSAEPELAFWMVNAGNLEHSDHHGLVNKNLTFRLFFQPTQEFLQDAGFIQGFVAEEELPSVLDTIFKTYMSYADAASLFVNTALTTTEHGDNFMNMARRLVLADTGNKLINLPPDYCLPDMNVVDRLGVLYKVLDKMFPALPIEIDQSGISMPYADAAALLASRKIQALANETECPFDDVLPRLAQRTLVGQSFGLPKNYNPTAPADQRATIVADQLRHLLPA